MAKPNGRSPDDTPDGRTRSFAERGKPGPPPGGAFPGPGVRVSFAARPSSRHTCELAGFAAVAEVDPDLAEWDYGDFGRQNDGRNSPAVSQLAALPRWLPGVARALASIGAPHDRVVGAAANGQRRRPCLLPAATSFTSSPLAGAAWMLPAADVLLLSLPLSKHPRLRVHDLNDPALRLWNDNSHLAD